MAEEEYKRLLKKISANVRRIRNKRGLTQEEMVEFGFNYRFYQKVESGNYSFNLYTLHRLASAFKASIQDFFR